MTKITLNSLANLQNESTAVSEINANSSTIVSSFDNTLSRDGTTPNQMMNNLDMNSNQIYNLPAPGSASSPARLQDVTGSVIISSVPPVGTSGAVVGYLNGNNTYSGNDAFSGNNTFTGTNTFTNVAPITVGANSGNNGLINFKGSAGGQTIVQASTTASGTLTLPAVTDTLTGKATTDTLTNKTYDTAGTGNVFKINGTTVSAVTGTGSVVLGTSPTLTTPVITGVTDASSAAAGKVGEVISSTIASGSAISITTATVTNITSITLSAGDWEVSGGITYINSAGASTLTSHGSSISNTSATWDITTGGRSVLTGCNGATWNAITGTSAIGALQIGNATPKVRINVNTPTNIYLVGFIIGSGTITAYGSIYARRIR